MAQEQDLLFIAIGCTVGGIFLIIVIAVVCCILCRNGSKRDRQHDLMKHSYNRHASRPSSYSSHPGAGISRWGSNPALINGSGPYYFKDYYSNKHAVNGYPLKQYSSESQLYSSDIGYAAEPNRFQRSVRRVRSFLQRNGPSFWQANDRSQKSDFELREDITDNTAGKKRPGIPTFANNNKVLSGTGTMTAKMDFESERGSVVGDSPERPLFTISKDEPHIARAYRNTDVSDGDVFVTPNATANASNIDNTGRYKGQQVPSYMHYEWRSVSFKPDSQNVYVSNPNVYFHDIQAPVHNGPRGYSAQSNGRISMSPGGPGPATVLRSHSAHERHAPPIRTTSPTKAQHTSSHRSSESSKQHNNEKLDAKKIKPQEKTKNVNKKKQKEDLLKEKQQENNQETPSPPAPPPAQLITMTSSTTNNDNIEHKQAGNEIYAVPSKKHKSGSKSGQTKIPNVETGEASTRVGVNNTPSPISGKPKDGTHGYDTIEGKKITANAFKFLDHYDDEHFPTGTMLTDGGTSP